MIVKKCKVCSTDISQKRTDTIFCSKKCKNLSSINILVDFTSKKDRFLVN